MKKQFLNLGVALLLAGNVFAQEDMSTTWMKNPTHKIDWSGMSEESGFVYASSLKEITVYKTETGEQIWNKEYKDLAPKFRKVDELIPMWDAKVFFIFNRRSGGDQMVVADMVNGQALWSSDAYEDLTDENIVYVPEAEAFAVSTKKALTFIKARTGQVLWETTKFKGVVGAYVIDTEEGSMTMLNYKPSALAALFSGFKNQITKVNLKNGDVIWDQTYRGILEKKVFTREVLARISLKGDKLFLFMSGIQVYEYKTGKPVWAAAYDETPKIKGKPANAIRYGIYDAIADPLVVGDFVYVLDVINPRKQYVKKYDLESGKLIWTSPEIPDARAIPNMYELDGVLVLQVGGTVEEQGYYKEVTNNADGSTTIRWYYEKDYIEVKPFNVQGFDVASGKSLWQSERMKKGITNMFPDGNDLIVCSGKALYRMDSKTGKEKYEMDITKDGVSQANKILDYNDNVIVVADKGLSIHRKSDGSLVKSAKYKRAVPVAVKSTGLGTISSGKSGINKLSGWKGDTGNGYSTIAGNSVAMQTKGGDIAVYNLDDCSFRQVDARKNANLLMTSDGNYVYVFEGGGTFSKSIVTKYKTKK
jgi:outer membrane protein assembly factor BamB